MSDSVLVKASGRKRHLFILIGLVILGAGITLSFTLLGHKTSDSQYFTQPVERGVLQSVVNATGTVQAVVTVQVGSQVSGQVQALYADYNSEVKRGQLLAKIDPRNFEAEVQNSQANLAAAEAHLRSAQADLATQEANLVSAKANLDAARVARDNDDVILKRYNEMIPSGIVAQNDFDTVKANADSALAKYNQAAAAVEQAQAQINGQSAQVEQAKAQVLQAQADLHKAQVNLDYTNILSPVDGVVVSRNVDVGQTVAASLQAPLLFVIANDLTKMQVNASVDEADIGHISDSSVVRFTVDAYPSQTFIGRIAEIRLNPQTIQNVVTYSVIINVDNSDLRLKPGMTTNITITVAKRDDVLKIPNAALRYLPQGITRANEFKIAGHASGSPGEPRHGSTGVEKASSVTSGEAAAEVDHSRQTAGAQAPPGMSSGSRRPRAPATRQSILAPGQLWQNSEKIQFPAPPANQARPAVVWVLDSNGKPEPRKVTLGITDGTFTEVVSGLLKQGEPVIVADTNQQSGGPTGPRSPFGFGRR